MKTQNLRVVLVAPLLLSAAALAPAASAQTPACQGSPGAGMVRLSVLATELRNGNGEVAFTLYPDSSSRFLAKGGKLLRARVPARAPNTAACFWVAPGHYAIATYHDEDGDHKFDRSLFAVKEGFGFSNDAPTTLGLPKFDRVRFAVAPTGTTIRIRTRYSR